MPSPERGPSGPSEQPRQPEHEPVPYHRTARFADDRTAAGVYQRIQETIFSAPCDLSAYRFLLDQAPHVTVLGAPPPPELDGHLEAMLGTGEPATLPSSVLQALSERRRQMSGQGFWREGHYRPGRRL